MLIAQISDFHIMPPGQTAYGGLIDTTPALKRCVSHLNALRPRPTAVVASGDLVNAGAVEEYAHLKRIVEPLAMPLYLLPGNHDDRSNLRSVFGEHRYLPREGDISYAVDLGPIRLVMADTVISGQQHGEMTPERLGQLDSRLAEKPDQPTLLFLHHPPFETGIMPMDVDNCRGGAALAEMLARHPQVLHVACGHVHRSVHTLWHGRTASIAPSTAHAVALDLVPNTPLHFRLEPPACHLHVWRSDGGRHGRFMTHLSQIGDYSGPHPF